MVRPPSGWTVFSNPNFVQGVAVHGQQLWAATRGGVVSWNLNTSQPRLYTTRDGLAEIQGTDVVYCPMPEERIIVAHPSGMLSAYDMQMKKWSRMPITFDDGSTLRGVRTLFCDSVNRRLMVGSADGLGILDEKTGEWRRIGPEQGLKADNIHAINVVGQAIWVAAGDKSAFLVMGSTVFPFNASSGFPSGSVNDLTVAPDTSIWFGYSTGLVHYRDKKWNSFGAQTPSGIPFLSVDQVEMAPNKHIWIASAEEGACPFNTILLNCSTIYPGIRGAPITDLVVDALGTAYVATDGSGVLVLEDEEVRHLRYTNEQLVSNDVYDITQSPDGRLWVATDVGISILEPGWLEEPWQKIQSQRNQLMYPHVSGLLPTANGMWFTYDHASQATFFDGKTWLQLDALKGLTGSIMDMALDQRGYVWFATDQGIKVWDGTVIRAYVPPSEIPSRVYNALLLEGDDMWVGTDRGLLLYQEYQWRMILPELTINTIAKNRDGGLLLGTDQGLVHFDGMQSYYWIINLGKEVVTNPRVTSIAYDGEGQLWIGTDGDGLFRYDGSSWQQFDTTTGLPTNRIRKIFTDHMGEVWIAAATGENGGALVRYMP